MARATRVVLTCDLHGDETDAVTTLVLADGTSRYELDVCQNHLDELTGPARRVRQRRTTRAARATSSKRRPTKRAARPAKKRSRRSVDTAAVREWARSNGYSIGERGRIPASIVDAYKGSK